MSMVRVNNVVLDLSEVVFARFHPDGFDNGPSPGLFVRFKYCIEMFHGEEAHLIWEFIETSMPKPKAKAKAK